MTEPDKPDRLTIISTLIAAAILIPIGWWLKETDPLGLTNFFAQWF